jgi:hypothetical protein
MGIILNHTGEGWKMQGQGIDWAGPPPGVVLPDGSTEVAIEIVLPVVTCGDLVHC